MERSLKTWRVGSYQVQVVRNAYRVRGLGPLWGRDFNLRRRKRGSWFLNLQRSGQRIRKLVPAKSLEDAVEWVNETYFYEPIEDEVQVSSQPEIRTVFEQWKETLLVKPSTLEGDYWPRVNQFIAWAEGQGLWYWGEIQSFHAEKYAVECAEQNARGTIELKCRVVKRASIFARKNYPQFDFPILNYFLPKKSSREDRTNRDTLTLDEGINFLIFLRDQPHGWNILPGVAVELLCSVRHQEMRQMRWRQVDFKEGTLSISRGHKGDQSYRSIPAPDLVLDILAEAFEREEPKPGDRVLVTWKRASFWRRFNEYRENFNSDLRIDPRGLRRTLLKEFFVRKRYCAALQLYRGHKPDNISDVDWEHYLDRLEYDPAAVLKMFREDVIGPLNEWLKTHREKWNSGRGKQT